jgi:hypothetical protein
MTTISGQSASQSLKKDDCPGLSGYPLARAGTHSQSEATNSGTINPNNGFMNVSGRALRSIG